MTATELSLEGYQGSGSLNIQPGVRDFEVRATVCPRSSDPFYFVNYYLKRVTTSLTYSNTKKIEKDSVYELNFQNNLSLKKEDN